MNDNENHTCNLKFSGSHVKKGGGKFNFHILFNPIHNAFSISICIAYKLKQNFTFFGTMSLKLSVVFTVTLCFKFD
jgi:hypothetical protein